MTSGSAPPKILLADADPASQRALSDYFREAGWLFETVENAGRVADAVSSAGFDLVIADTTLPGADWFTVINRILLENPAQAVIVLSPSCDYGDAVKYFRTGVSDLVSRPLDIPWLKRSIHQLIRMTRDDQRDKQLYRFVQNEECVIELTARELAQVDHVSLPIIERLYLAELLSQNHALRLKVAIQEVLTNAVDHGNLGLPSAWKEELEPCGRDKYAVMRERRLADSTYGNKRVWISYSYDGAELVVRVEDEGQGFLNRPSASSVSPGPQCFGRGLALIESAVDQVAFEKNGAKIILTKLLNRSPKDT